MYKLSHKSAYFKVTKNRQRVTVRCHDLDGNQLLEINIYPDEAKSLEEHLWPVLNKEAKKAIVFSIPWLITIGPRSESKTDELSFIFRVESFDRSWHTFSATIDSYELKLLARQLANILRPIKK